VGCRACWQSERAADAQAINSRDIPGFFLRTQEQGAAVIEAIGSAHAALQFDIYHCQVAQGDVTRRLETLMPPIAHIPIADAAARNEPGSGEIAWDTVFRHVDELGYRAWVGCEYQPAREPFPAWDGEDTTAFSGISRPRLPIHPPAFRQITPGRQGKDMLSGDVMYLTFPTSKSF